LQRDLGLLPALDGQYFVAGLIPLLVFALLYGAWRFLPKPPRARWLVWALPAAAIVILAGWIGFDSGERWLFVLALLVMLLGGWIAGGSVAGVALAVVVALFYVYVDRIFPRLPQELGGPRPECVTLDVVAAQLSATTLKELGLTASAGVMRTQPLHLIYRGGGLAVVRKGDGPFMKIADRTIATVVNDAGCPPYGK
jgi:hypothetical protein